MDINSDLFSKHVSDGASDYKDHGEEQQQDEIGEDEALDLLLSREDAEGGEGDDGGGGDEGDVGGVDVEPAPEELREEGLVPEGPDGEGEEDEAGEDGEEGGGHQEALRHLPPLTHRHWEQLAIHEVLGHL